MIAELVNKYSNAIENSAVIISREDLGAVRLALRLALDELQAARQADVAHQDAVVADLLAQRDQLQAQTAGDSAELLHLQTSHDRLLQWLVSNRPEQAAALAVDADITDVIIAVLSEPARYAVTTAAVVSESPAVTLAPVARSLTGRVHSSNFRYSGTDAELRSDVHKALHTLTKRLGRTPSMNDFNATCREFNLPTVDGVRKRLDISWKDLCRDAGLQPNHSFGHGHKQEGKADNAEAPFRSI